MNGNQISLWRFDPSVSITAKVFFPRATAISVWDMKYAIQLELQEAKL